MADSFTANLNLRKPEVGAAHDTWGGLAGLNGDLDLLDAVFLATGLGTSVGLHVGTGKVANIEGTLLVADPTDTSAGFMFDASDITTATIRTLKAPDASGTIALRSEVTALVPTGSLIQGIWATAPAGYVLADGRTIGSATSGATSRANADCEALFSLVWTQFPAAPIFTFEGIASTRGANAAADFAANKRLTMFDARGRGLAGLDNMGGTAAGVLPGYTTMGQVGGALTSATGAFSMSGTNNINFGNVAFNYQSGGATVINNSVSGLQFGGSGVATQYGDAVNIFAVAGYTTINASFGISVSGASGAFNIVQPTVVVNVAVKL